MSDPIEVLDYWLGAVGPGGWYAGGDDLDAEIAAIWGDLWQAAQAEGLEHWVDGPAATLAYLVVTDQFPRNMFRGTAQAFATDALALRAAKQAVAAGWDMMAPAPERQFFYLPFEHSEDPGDQETAVRLIAERMPDAPETLRHARAHQAVIARFGRFPYRNAALGRANTAEEQAYLAEGGYGATLRSLGA